MSDPADHLRSAADHIEDARTDLQHGDLEMTTERLEAQVTGLDDVASEMVSTLRQVAILEETESEAVDDE